MILGLSARLALLELQVITSRLQASVFSSVNRGNYVSVPGMLWGMSEATCNLPLQLALPIEDRAAVKA